MSALTLAEAGIVLCEKNHIGRTLAEIRDRARPVQADTPAYICNAISQKAGAVVAHGPGFQRGCADQWRAASLEERAEACREIIAMALRVGSPAVKAIHDCHPLCTGATV